MRLALKFKESGDRLNLNFGEVYQISDGGFEKGYEAGVQSMQGIIDEYNEEISLQNELLETAISEMNGKVDPELYEKGFNEGFVEGKKSVVDFSKICTAIRFKSLNCFGEKEVVLNLDNAKNFENVFYEEADEDLNTTVERITINCPNEIKRASHMFRAVSVYNRDYTLKHITLNVKFADTANWNYAFAYRSALEVIDGEPLNIASNPNYNIFANCEALKEVRIVPNCVSGNFEMIFCPLLSKETIESVINGLSSEVSGFTAKLKLQAVNKAFETTENANNGSSSTAWQMLVNTKPTWTITLS